MVSIRKIRDSEIAELEDIIRILADPSDQKKFAAIDQGMKISAKYIWIMTDIPRLGVTDYIGDNAGTVRRFFNETVAFITGSKARPIRIESWDGIIRDIVRQYDLTQTQIGNVGSLSVSRSIERRGLTAGSVGDSEVDKTLLSYGHDKIMLKWIVREDGVYDMLKTIMLLASVYKRYYPNADGSPQPAQAPSADSDS